MDGGRPNPPAKVLQRTKLMTNHRVKNSWVPDRPDFRDHAFELAKPIPLPTAVDLRPGLPPVYDQGDLGSCTANAICAAFDFERHKQGKPFLSPSRLFLYYNERAMEGTVDSDGGGMLRDGIKSVSKQGVCAEAEWAYDISKFASQPPPPCYAAALNNQALVYRRIAASTLSMIYCLAYGFPFVFGFSVYESFMSDAVAKTGVVPMPDYSEAQVGGHAVVAVGYDQTRRAFLVRNSWGPDWGIVGYFWMPYEYAASPDLADDRWEIKLVEAE